MIELLSVEYARQSVKESLLAIITLLLFPEPVTILSPHNINF